MPIVRLSNLEQFAAVKINSDGGAIGGKVQVPQCAQIILQWSLEGGKIAENVLYGRYAGGFAGSQAQADAIHSALGTGAQWTALAAHLAPSTLFGNVAIRDVNTPDNGLISGSGSGKPGTSTGTALPAETAVVITKRTAKAGPAFRGRLYLSGFATTALGTGNVVAAPALTAINAWAATIANALLASGYTHVLGLKARQEYLGSTGTLHPARPAQSIDVTSMAGDNHWDTQRRRGLE